MSNLIPIGSPSPSPQILVDDNELLENWPIIFIADERGFVRRIPISNIGSFSSACFSHDCSCEPEESTAQEQPSGSASPITLDQLPPEVLTEIFLRVDQVDLFESCLFVCKRFYSLIRSPEFCLARFEPELGRRALRSVLSWPPSSIGAISLEDLRLSFGRNLFTRSRQVSRWWSSKSHDETRIVSMPNPRVNGVMRRHRCPKHAREVFEGEVTALLAQQPQMKDVVNWLERPICVCVFDQPDESVGRAMTHWLLDFDDRCAKILDMMCPPLAVGVWAPDGDSSQFLLLSACLEAEDGSPLATIDVQHGSEVVGPLGRRRLFVYLIFRNYPTGVRRVNIQFRNIYSSHPVTSGRAAVFTGATVRLLLPRHENNGYGHVTRVNDQNLSSSLNFRTS